MNAIYWPAGFVSGHTDNFVPNEIIVANLSVSMRGPEYYKNSDNVRLYDNKGSILTDDVRFSFSTFVFLVEAEIVECVALVSAQPARLAWHGWAGEQASPQRFDVHHASLLEDLPDNRVRILTQETQKGAPARVLPDIRPISCLMLIRRGWVVALQALPPSCNNRSVLPLTG